MTSEDARLWIAERFGSEAASNIAAFLDMVIAENARQNLISPATIDAIWTRHALDSAQLVELGRAGPWIDVGPGGGFPGMIVALLRPDPLKLVEPRAKRAEFLRRSAERLGLKHVEVVVSKVERVAAKASVISARAVASVEKLLQIAAHCATSETRWLLPRGRIEDGEIDRLRATWEGMFHVEPSATDPSSSILVIDGVRPR